MARRDLKELVARQVAQGLTTAEVATANGLTPTRARSIIQHPETKQLIEQQRTRLLDAGSRAMMRFLMNADTLADMQLQVALDPGDPNSYKARTWILDRIIPQRTNQGGEVHVNLAINQEVMVGIKEALDSSSKVLDSTPMGHVKLVPGKEALPSINTDMSTDPEPALSTSTPDRRPNGSAPQEP